MDSWFRRIGAALLGAVVIVVVYSLIYQWAMSSFEGQERSFFEALQVVIESLTTAGFGGDTEYWNTTQVNLLVIAMNLTGVLLVFLAIPLFAVPAFRQAFYTKPPDSSSLTDHVIVCGHSHRDEVLCGELEAADIPYLYIDNDPDVVQSLLDRDVPAMIGDSERVDTLRAANIEEARAIVADINDEVNPTVILSAKRANPDIKVLSVAREEDAAEYHRYAGADEVIEAPRVLGESLGLRAITSLAEKVRDALGSDTNVTEILIEEESELVGQTLREIDIFGADGIRVFGGWFGGKLLVPPDPDVKIVENTILLVAGEFDSSTITTRTLPAHLDERSRILIGGYGVVGHAAASVIEERGNGCDIIDIDPSTDPDTVGDVTDTETFLHIDISSYRSVVLALNSDPTTIYTALILENIAPDVEVIARVHNPDNVWKLYSAGADYVLSMSVITGEMLAAELINEREIITPHDEIEFDRVPAGELVGQTIAEVDIRSRYDVTVIAVDRAEEAITDLGPDFEFEPGDELVVAGGPIAVDEFATEFS